MIHVDRKASLRLARALPVLALVAACGGKSFDQPMRFGDKVVEAKVLERGREIYNRYCATCHGADGKAQTAQGGQLDPRPRDFTLAQFKHKLAPGDGLPTDAELKQVVRHGIPGSQMPAWPNLDPDDLDAVVQYLKTFAPRWQTDAPHDSKASAIAPGDSPQGQSQSGSEPIEKSVRPAQ